MKKIVRIERKFPVGTLVVDYSTFRQNEEFGYISVPYTEIFANIVVKGFTTIPEELVKQLTNQYLHGAKIEFEKLGKSYQVKYPSAFYTYAYKELDLTAPVPSALAKFKFMKDGIEITYLDAIKELKDPRYLPNYLWNALDEYSKQRIARCKELNRGNYAIAEQWYKTLMKDCRANHMKMYSPNDKTYYEVIAEEKFQKDYPTLNMVIINYTLNGKTEEIERPKDMYAKKLEYLKIHGAVINSVVEEKPLTAEEEDFLIKYGPAYDVQVQTFKWNYFSRKTKSGWTEEIQRVACDMSKAEWDRLKYNPDNENNIPSFVKANAIVFNQENEKLKFDAYRQLQWIIKNLGDEGLHFNYKRCPVCGEIYNINKGCECGACKPITVISGDAYFNGAYASPEEREMYPELAVNSDEDEYIELDDELELEEV